MARRRPPPRTTHPDAPVCPPEFDEAPPEPATGVVWDGVLAGPDVVVPDGADDVRVKESRLVGVDLSQRRLKGWVVRDTHFERCDLSGAVFTDAAFERVAFTGCRLTGTTLWDSELRDVSITDSVADLLSLHTVTARTMVVESTRMRGAELRELRARDCAFLDCDLTGADLEGARMYGTRLHRSTLTDVQGALSLRGCEITTDQLAALGMALATELEITIEE